MSAVFRNTIIQFAAPDAMRGRLQGVQMAVVAGGPRLGDLEAGVVATVFGDTVSVVSGGLACVVGADCDFHKGNLNFTMLELDFSH